MPANPRARAEAQDDVTVQSARRREVDIFERRRIPELGVPQALRQFPLLARGPFGVDEQAEAVVTRNGFTPVVRAQLFKKFRGLEIKDCPFVNLPEAKSGRWGAGLTAAKMKDCRWLKPVLVAQIEFLEWTGENHLRHTKFIALRDDKPAREVMRE